MTDEEFIREEISFKEAVSRFIDVCKEYGISAEDRINDILFEEDINTGD